MLKSLAFLVRCCYWYEVDSERNKMKDMLFSKPRGWLRQNMDKSRKHEESVHHIQQDITRLMHKLQADIGVGVIRFDSVWGFQHFRGCLKSFDRLYNDYPQFLKHILKGGYLVPKPVFKVEFRNEFLAHVKS